MNESLEHLVASVDRLSQETVRVRGELRRRTLTLWVALAACGVLALVMGLGAYTVGRDNRRAIERNNQRWCPFVEVFIVKPGEPQPTTERGRIIVQRAIRLYDEFNCR